jgi:hypothetical protein
LPVRFADDGIGPVGYAVILITNPVTVGIVQLTIQRWLDRIPSIGAVVAGMLLIGIGIAVTGAGQGLVWFCAASTIWVLGEIAMFGPGVPLVTGIAPPGQEASYTGVWLSTVGLSTITASVGGAWIIHLPGLRLGGDHLSGLPLLWTACALAGVVTSTGCVLLARPLKRRAQLMDEARSQVAGDAPAILAALRDGRISHVDGQEYALPLAQLNCLGDLPDDRGQRSRLQSPPLMVSAGPWPRVSVGAP